MSEQCSAIKSGGGYHSGRCSRAASVKEEGKWWCRQHAPSIVAKRADERAAKFEAEWAARRKRWAEADKWRKREIACTAAFEDPAGRKIATEDIAEGTFWNVYRFMQWVAWQPCTCAEDSGCMSCQACDLMSELKVQEPEK